MTITVRELIEHPRLNLRLISATDPAALDAPIIWVHQSELADSSAFAEPGEVLVTTGSQFPKPSAENQALLAKLAAEYAAGLRASGVVALGFGTHIHHAAAPEPLVRAVEDNGLPLFEIPLELPFSAIIKTVSQVLSQDQEATLRRANTAQRRLVAAAATKDPLAAIVSRTAEILGGWAAFVDADGRVAARSHLAVSGAAAKAAQDLAASGKTALWSTRTAGPLFAQTVRSGGDSPLGALVAGSALEFDPFATSTVLLAADLLAAFATKDVAGDSAMNTIRSAIMAELLDGNVGLARAVGAALWSGFPPEPVVLVCATGPLAELDRVMWGLAPFRAGARSRLAPLVFGRVGGAVYLAVPAVSAEEAAARLATAGALAVGCSGPHGWAEMAGARREAAGAAALAQAERGSRDTASAASLLDLLTPEELWAYARARLGRLLDPGKARRRDLETLGAVLEADGALGQAAAALGVHRHTVRRRLERIEELAGVSLKDPAAKHELWFAHQAALRADKGSSTRPETGTETGTVPISGKSPRAAS
ncbi:MAG: PucR family transcriptional regulator [Bifidobacteriaceae bacterium]|nr:PucR family transcriptional regulator [Bifidobacteriaceae bacterium]